jgi:hypothetical protein
VSRPDPWPPADLHCVRLAFSTLKPGTRLHRFHARAFHPIYFDRSLMGRLNAPDGSYGVLYTAKHRLGAFAETFLRQPGRTLLPHDLMIAKASTTIEVTGALRVVRLYGPALAKVGCTAQVTHGALPYHLPQAWSKAIHDHPAQPDGIAYRSRHDDNQICYAIFERALSKVAVAHRELDLDQDWFYELANHYRVGVAPGP